MHTGTKKCFSEIELGAFLEGKLSSEEKDALKLRIFECKPCWDELISITGIIAQKDKTESGDVPGHLIEKAIAMFPEKQNVFDIVISMVKDSINLISSTNNIHISTPAFAASLRSEKVEHPEMLVLKKSFDDIDVELDIEKVAEDQCNIKVAIDDLRTKILMNTLRIELISQGRELVSNLFENGETTLEDISAGQYTIRIHKNGKIFGEITLQIK